MFALLWGIPFVVLGQYMIWGRFLHDAWLKRRTYYAVTNRRVLALQEGWDGQIRKTIWTFLRDIPSISREGTDSGTLWFGTKYPIFGGKGEKKRSMSRFDLGDITVFADIRDVDFVHRLVMDLRAKIESRPSTSPILTYRSHE